MKYESKAYGEDFERLPTGYKSAICVNVIDGRYEQDMYSEDKKYSQKIWLLFEIETKYTMGDRRGYGMLVSKKFKLSTHPKSSLRPFLEAWRGKPFIERRVGDNMQMLGKNNEVFDIDSLIGSKCVLNLVEITTGSGKKMVVIKDVSKLTAPFVPVIQTTHENYVPEWIQKLINSNPINDPSETKDYINPQVVTQGGVDSDIGDEEDVPF